MSGFQQSGTPPGAFFRQCVLHLEQEVAGTAVGCHQRRIYSWA
jgi:hypothetical protein